MTPIPLEQDDIPEALEIFRLSYKGVDVPESEYEWFEKDLKGSFDSKQNYQITFFKLCEDNQIISFAAIGKSGFMRGSWELRWGTTRPEHQGKGLMSLLTQHRIEYAIEHSPDIPGIIHICSRSPGLYLKQGFEEIYARGPENKAHYLVKYINNANRYVKA